MMISSGFRGFTAMLVSPSLKVSVLVRVESVLLTTPMKAAPMRPLQDPLAVQAILAYLARSGAPAPPGPAPPAPAAIT